MTAPALPRPAQLRRARRRKQAAFRWVVVGLLMIFFLAPFVALLDFSTRRRDGSREWTAWEPIGQVFSGGSLEGDTIRVGLINSLWLVLLTIVIMLVLLLPAMIWVKLRLPKVRRVMEFISLLPLTIPAVVLVVGLAPMYRVISNVLSTEAIWLCFAYAILVLPFAYRALDSGLEAIDAKTLSEAARSLGSSWPLVMWRIIVPNIKSAVVSACFLSLALVMGEFTIASLLGRTNLQTAIFQVGQADPRTASALALLALVFAFVLLVGLSFVSGRKKSERRTRVTTPGGTSALDAAAPKVVSS